MSNDLSNSNEFIMRRALELAAHGIGLVSPGPLVGCLITDPKGKTVGEGAYIYADINHAEGVALQQAGKKAKGGTAYITLEPHNHHGRTAPCTEALINAGIKRVVYAIDDPNPLVSGNGYKRLKAAGIEVVCGILADEAARQNEKYIHWHQTGLPFVHFKSAVSLDGRIATRTGDSQWITNELARQKAHELRHEYDAILIGSNTAVTDNPSLTDRSGKPRRRPLVRVVLDNSLQLSLNSNLVLTAKEVPTIVFTDNENPEKAAMLRDEGVEIIPLAEGGRNLAGVLQELAKRDLQSVLIEGGAAVAGDFYDSRLIDKVTFFIAPMVIGGAEARLSVAGSGTGTLSSAMKLKDTEITLHGDNVEVTGYPDWNEQG